LITTGITRDQSSLTEVTIESEDIALKNLNRWTPTDYINIWLVREICSAGSGCGVAGYAYFPASHGNPEDGIVMEAEYMGSSPGGTGVLAHEMGHYLGLYHTFQGGCTNDMLQFNPNLYLTTYFCLLGLDPGNRIGLQQLQYREHQCRRHHHLHRYRF